MFILSVIKRNYICLEHLVFSVDRDVFSKIIRNFFFAHVKFLSVVSYWLFQTSGKNFFVWRICFFFSKSITNFFIWLKIKKGFAWLGVPGQCSKRCTKVFLFKKLIFLWVEKNFCVEICLIGCFRLVKMQPAYSNSRTDKTCFEIKFKDKSSHIHMEVVIRGIKIDIV